MSISIFRSPPSSGKSGSRKKTQGRKGVPIQIGEVRDTDADEVSSFLKTRNNKSAPGSDGIRWKHLKVMNKQRPELLPELYNGCMKFGVFPEEWKSAFVRFIPKPEKSFEDTGSYRPISLPSCLGKTLERVIKTRLPDQFEDR